MTPDHILTTILAAVLGAVFGSFVNVLILRWHEEVSIGGRSKCPSCEKKLHFHHLIPIISWLMLRGRCAFCQKKIHPQYPLVEAAAMIFAIIAAVRHDPLLAPGMFAFEFFIPIFLIVPIVMDWRWKELPVEFLLGLACVAAGFQGMIRLNNGATWSAMGMDLGLALVIVLIFFGGQFFLSKGRWLGEGDVWFGLVIAAAAFSPLRTIISIYLAYIIGGGTAMVGLLMGIYKKGARLPFAPALAAGVILTMWYGPTIEAWVRISLM